MPPLQQPIRPELAVPISQPINRPRTPSLPAQPRPAIAASPMLTVLRQDVGKKLRLERPVLSQWAAQSAARQGLVQALDAFVANGSLSEAHQHIGSFAACLLFGGALAFQNYADALATGDPLAFAESCYAAPASHAPPARLIEAMKYEAAGAPYLAYILSLRARGSSWATPVLNDAGSKQYFTGQILPTLIVYALDARSQIASLATARSVYTACRSGLQPNSAASPFETFYSDVATQFTQHNPGGRKGALAALLNRIALPAGQAPLNAAEADARLSPEPLRPGPRAESYRPGPTPPPPNSIGAVSELLSASAGSVVSNQGRTPSVASGPPPYASKAGVSLDSPFVLDAEWDAIFSAAGPEAGPSGSARTPSPDPDVPLQRLAKRRRIIFSPIEPDAAARAPSLAVNSAAAPSPLFLSRAAGSEEVNIKPLMLGPLVPNNLGASMPSPILVASSRSSSVEYLGTKAPSRGTPSPEPIAVTVATAVAAAPPPNPEPRLLPMLYNGWPVRISARQLIALGKPSPDDAQILESFEVLGALVTETRSAARRRFAEAYTGNIP